MSVTARILYHRPIRWPEETTDSHGSPACRKMYEMREPST
jgi:hypothetical protein